MYNKKEVAMCEVIILAEWKKQKEIQNLNALSKELSELMEYLSVQREFYMFDAAGNAVLIHSEGVCK